ncbi:PspC domain-containing protein [Candidatus Methanoliparum sp. LAM-1]|nr:PspC domain-containing protein [Candidatus Methanoliparum sp. LAM-1]BDC35649.1 hypothetical protein MTLP_03310 [Candidatus Methanoliparum sp. LAM-1]
MNKRLYRSKKNKIIGGVCGGIAEYLDIDPTVIRIIYVLLTIFTEFLPGIIVYLLLWLIIPNEPEKDDEIKEIEKTDDINQDNTSKALSIAIIVLGAIFLIYGILRFIIISGWWTINLHWHIFFGLFFPIVSVILGVILILIGLKKL